ncbi:MAG: AAA family ATPase [Clostridiales bacterium]|nr:AAA family ATPase [Clostridiales bacterium]
MNEKELNQEREYTRMVQSLLLQAIENSKANAREHLSSIKQMLADAWEDLRLKPTALSEQDMQVLSGEVERYLARKAFNDDVARRYEKMLMEPFFARVDFKPDDEDEKRKIVIGLYSLTGAQGDILVHDWRAPVCSLYYDAMPGRARYDSPQGIISGEMSLKRQYRMEDGRLKYYVNTDVNIEDSLLLDILEGATHRHIRQIVSTIQAEQNRAIRFGNEKLLSVVGSAGSGKTSVAMHRIAYLMYRYRDKLEAEKILVLSPSNSFSEYISTVLPELGEENVPSLTMYKLLTGALKCKIEHPLEQNEKLLTPEGYPRRVSVKFKSALDFLERLRNFAVEFSRTGPEFRTLRLDSNVLCEKEEMERMYRVAFVQLKPAQRIERIRNVLESRLEKWEFTLLESYCERLKNQYSGRELDIAARFNVSHRLQPLRQEIKALAKVTVSELYARALSDAPDGLGQIAAENAGNKVVWWEDAPGIMYLSLYLGFTNPERNIRHLVVDEAQDYSSVALAALSLYYPMAHVTLLGDPKQRTTPGMHMLDPETWNACFMTPGAPMLKLTRCYRSTLNITRLCNAILPDGEQVAAFGREGDNPEILPLTDKNVLDAVKDCQDKGYKSVCVVTRTLKQADRLSRLIPQAHLLDGSDEDILSDPGDVAVAGYQLMKGLEFDAVVVAWPSARLTDGERRRLYTACSRALHKLTLCADETLLKELAIIA